MQRLAPLMEEPMDQEEQEEEKGGKSTTRSKSWKKWIKTQLQFMVFHKKPDMKVLLSVMGCPLFPVPPLSKISLQQVLYTLYISVISTYVYIYTYMKIHLFRLN